MLNVTTSQWKRKLAKETHYKQTFQNIVCKLKIKHNESAFALVMEFLKKRVRWKMQKIKLVKMERKMETMKPKKKMKIAKVKNETKTMTRGRKREMGNKKNQEKTLKNRDKT